MRRELVALTLVFAVGCGGGAVDQLGSTQSGNTIEEDGGFDQDADDWMGYAVSMGSLTSDMSAAIQGLADSGPTPAECRRTLSEIERLVEFRSGELANPPAGFEVINSYMTDAIDGYTGGLRACSRGDYEEATELFTDSSRSFEKMTREIRIKIEELEGQS